jgi:hypothetical protein
MTTFKRPARTHRDDRSVFLTFDHDIIATMPPQADTATAITLLRESLIAHGVGPELAESYSTVVYAYSVETRPWSPGVGSLLTLRPNPATPLNITNASPPLATYYSPVKAAMCAGHVLHALFTDNPALLGISILCAFHALRGVTTEVSPAEALLLSQVYYATNRTIDIESARLTFTATSSERGRSEPAGFDIAVHNLRRLGCLEEDMGSLRIVDWVVIRP